MEPSILNDLMEYSLKVNNDLWHLGTLLNILSIICIFTQFYKFFTTDKTQSLVTKYLTHYSFFLLLHCISFLIFVLPKNISSALIDYNNLLFFWLYSVLMTSFLKLVIAVEICLFFRKITKHLQHPPSAKSQKKKFLVNCSLGTIIPTVYMLIWLVLWRKAVPYLELSMGVTMDIIRVSRLIPTCLAFWYKRSLKVDTTEVSSKFPLHIRLLILFGGFAAVLSVPSLFMWIVQFIILAIRWFSNVQPFLPEKNPTPSTIEIIVISVHLFGTLAEGILIGVFFTFKKDTFRSAQNSTQNSTQMSSC